MTPFTSLRSRRWVPVVAAVAALALQLACRSDPPTQPDRVPFSATGIVLELDTDAPVSGAIIRTFVANQPYQATTDSAGRFSLALPTMPSYDFQVDSVGYESVQTSDAADRPLTFRLRRTRMVSGLVTEINGSPLAGVSVVPGPAGTGGAATTNVAGAFTVNAAATLQFRKIFYLGRTIPVPADGDVGQVRLQQQITLSTGESFIGLLTPNDVDYRFNDTASDPCAPCHFLDIDPIRQTQNIRVTVSWSGDQPLQVWASPGTSQNTVKGIPFGGSSMVSVDYTPRSELSSTFVLVGRSQDAPPLQGNVQYAVSIAAIKRQ